MMCSKYGRWKQMCTQDIYIQIDACLSCFDHVTYGVIACIPAFTQRTCHISSPEPIFHRVLRLACRIFQTMQDKPGQDFDGGEKKWILIWLTSVNRRHTAWVCQDLWSKMVQMEPWTSFISGATHFDRGGNLWSLGYILDYWVIMGGMWPTWTELQELIQCSLWMQTGFGPQTDQSMLQWPAPAPWRCPTLRKRRTELRCFAMQPGELLHHGLKIYISHVILILIFEDPLKSRKMKMDPDIASFPDTICASKEATKNMVDRTAFCVSLHKPQDIGIAADSGDSPCFSRLQLPLALILCNGDLHCNPCSLRSLYHHLGHQCSSTGMRNKIKPCQAAGGLLPYPTCSTCCFFFSRLGQQRQVHQIHCPCRETMGNGDEPRFFGVLGICRYLQHLQILQLLGHAMPRKNDTRNEEMPKRHDDLPGIAERKWEPRYRTRQNVLDFSETRTCHGLFI